MQSNMIMFEGRMTTIAAINATRANRKKVIITPSETTVDTAKEEIKDKVVEAPKEVSQEVVIDELEKARKDYKNLFWKKASSLMKLETITNKIAEANEA